MSMFANHTIAYVMTLTELPEAKTVINAQYGTMESCVNNDSNYYAYSLELNTVDSQSYCHYQGIRLIWKDRTGTNPDIPCTLGNFSSGFTSYAQLQDQILTFIYLCEHKSDVDFVNPVKNPGRPLIGIAIEFTKNGVYSSYYLPTTPYNSQTWSFSCDQRYPSVGNKLFRGISVWRDLWGSLKVFRANEMSVFVADSDPCVATQIPTQTIDMFEITTMDVAVTRDLNYLKTNSAASLNNDPNFCGTSYTMTMTPARDFSLTLTQGILTGSNSDPAKNGSYTQSITVCLGAICSSPMTFTVVVSCDNDAPVISSDSVLIEPGTVAQPATLTSFTQTQNNQQICPYIATLASVTPTPAFTISLTTNTASGGIIQINGATKAHAGTYTIVIRNAQGVNANMWLVVQDPCKRAIFQTTATPALSNMNLIRDFDSAKTQTFVVKTDVEELFGLVCNYIAALSQSWSYVSLSGTQASYTITAGPAQTQLADVGPHTVDITVSSLDYSASVTQKHYSFDVIVQHCVVNSFTMPAMPNVNVGVMSAGISGFFYAAVMSDLLCLYQITYSFTFAQNGVQIAQPPFTSFNSFTKAIAANPTLPTEVGDYSVTIMASIPQPSLGNGATKQVSTTFTLTITPDCASAKLNDVSISNMAVKVSLSSTQPVAFSDSKEVSYAIPGYCGARVYTFAGGQPTFLQIDSTQTTLTLSTMSPLDIGDHNIQFTVSLLNFPAVTGITKNFVASITCEVFQLTLSPLLTAMNVETGIIPKTGTQKFDVIRTPDCSQSVSFQFTPPPPGFVSLISPTATSVTVQVSGQAVLGDQQEYPLTLRAAVDAQTIQSSFTLVLYTCEQPAQFSPNPVISFILGDPTKVTWRMPQNINLCGTFTPVLPQPTTNFIITASDSDELIVSIPQTGVEGVYSAKISFVSNRSPPIEISSVLTIHALSPIILCNTITPILTSLTKTEIEFAIRGPPIVFEVPQFSFGPPNCEKPKLIYSLQNQSDGAQPTVFPQFIKFNPDLKIVQLAAGKELFGEQNKEFKFRLFVQNESGSIRNSDYFFNVKTKFQNAPPKFASAIEFNEVQIGKLIEFKLPKVEDPEFDKIAEVSLSPANSYLKLSQSFDTLIFDGTLANETDIGLQGVKIKITDEFGGSSVYEQQLLIIPEEIANNSTSTNSTLLNNTSTNSTGEISQVETNSTQGNCTGASDTGNSTNELDGLECPSANSTESGNNTTSGANQTEATDSGKRVDFDNEMVPATQMQAESVQEKPIILEKQERVQNLYTPDFDSLAFSKRVSSFSARTEQAKTAKVSCVPKRFLANDEGVIKISFHYLLKTEDLAQLINQIIEADSIQLELIKTDSLIPFSAFNWTMAQSSETSLQIKLNFTQPETISSSSLGQDLMRVVFKDTKDFIRCPQLDESRRELSGEIPQGTEIFVMLPAFATSSVNTTKAFVSFSSTPSSQGTIWGTMFLNYVIGLSGTLLWGGINALQLITSTALFDIYLPDNCQLTFQFLKNMTKFDLLYDIYDPNSLMNYTETPPFNDRFQSLGLEELNFFSLLGSLMIFVIILVCMQLFRAIFPCLAKLPQSNFKMNKKSIWAAVQHSGLFTQDKFSVTNAWVRFTLEGFIDVVLAGTLALFSRKTIIDEGGTPNAADMIAFASAIIALIFAGMFFLLVLILTKSDFKKSSEFQQLKKQIEMTNKKILYYEGMLNLNEKQQTSELPNQERFKCNRLLSSIKIWFASKLSAYPDSDLSENENSNKLSSEESKVEVDESVQSNSEESQSEDIERPASVRKDQLSFELDEVRENEILIEEELRNINHDESQLRGIDSLLIEIIEEEIKRDQTRKVVAIISEDSESIDSENILRPYPDIKASDRIDEDLELARGLKNEEENEQANKDTDKVESKSNNDDLLQVLAQANQPLAKCEKESDKDLHKVRARHDELKSDLERLMKTESDFEEILGTRWLNEKYVSALLDGICADDPSALYFNLMFLSRRLLIVLCAVLIQQYASIQIFVTVLATEAMMIYTLQVKPFEDRQASYLEVFNECTFMIVLYHHAVLKSWYFGESATTNLGISMNCTIGVLILVHMSIIGSNGVQYLIRTGRKLWRRKCTKQGKTKRDKSLHRRAKRNSSDAESEDPSEGNKRDGQEAPLDKNEDQPTIQQELKTEGELLTGGDLQFDQPKSERGLGSKAESQDKVPTLDQVSSSDGTKRNKFATSIALPAYRGADQSKNLSKVENFKPEHLFREMIAKQNLGTDSKSLDSLFNEILEESKEDKSDLGRKRPQLKKRDIENA